MKRHHLLFLFAAFIAITSSAQKLDNLEELKQFYKIDKLETDNTSLLLKMYNDMQKEIAEKK